MKKSPFSIIMVSVVLSLLGWATIPTQNIQFIPSPKTNQIYIDFQWPGASKYVVENEVINQLERTITEIPEVKHVFSISSNGYGNLNIEFESSTDRAFFRFQVASAIRRLYPSLPAGVSYPSVSFYNASEQETAPILTYALTGMYDKAKLYSIVNEILLPKLTFLPGVERVMASEQERYGWTLALDMLQLRALAIEPAEIEDKVKQHFHFGPMGQTQVLGNEFFVNLVSNSEDDLAEILPNIFIGKKGDKEIYLQDVAKIKADVSKLFPYYRLNGKQTVRIFFYAAENANVLRVSKAIKNEVKKLNIELPLNMSLLLEDDSTTYLGKELNKVIFRTVVSLCILLLLFLVAYRDFRYIFTLFLAVWVNLGVALVIYWILKIELHLYAFAGITVSFGLVIDNCVLMIHHFSKHRDRKVISVLITSTLTSIAALLVIFLLPEEWQLLLAEFSLVIIINLFVALVLSWFFIPPLLKLFFEGKIEFSKSSQPHSNPTFWLYYHNYLRFFSKKRILVSLLVVLLFGLPIFLLPNQIKNQPWYNKTLGSSYFLEHIKPLASKYLGGTLRLFANSIYERNALQEEQESALIVQATMPPGTTPDQLNEVFLNIDTFLMQYEDQLSRFKTIVRQNNSGQIVIYFNDDAAFDFPFILKNRLKNFALKLGEISWEIFGVGDSFFNELSSDPPKFRAVLLGYNTQELDRHVVRFTNQLLLHPRIQKVNPNGNLNWWEKSEYKLQLSKVTSSNSLLETNAIQRILRQFNQTPRPFLILPNGEWIKWEPSNLPNYDYWKLESMAVEMQPYPIPFSDLMRLEKVKSTNSLYKRDQQYIRLIDYEYNGEMIFGQKYLDGLIDQFKKELPLGYSIEQERIEGNLFKQHYLPLLVLVTYIIFLVSAIQFESFRIPVLIICSIPISFIGIFLAFYWVGCPFDQGGYASFLLVSGLGVNNLILLFFKVRGIASSHPKNSAISNYVMAIQASIAPILISNLTTLLSLLPFLLTSNGNDVFWQALVVGTYGGLIFSILSLFLIYPIIFLKCE